MRFWQALSVLALAGIRPGHALHFAVYGDARTNPDLHQHVVDAISRVDPELVLFSGDLWDGYGATTEASQAVFKSVLTKNENIAKLLRNNLYLVSRGNHETEGQLLSFRPTLVREGKTVYAFTQGNCFFVSLAMDPTLSLDFLETSLQSPEAKLAAWKIVYAHYPVYSTGAHGAQGLTGLEKLCDKYGVNVVFSGHDHMYERTHQIYAGKAVDTTSRLRAGKGTVYIVSGGGGAPLYPVGRQWWTRFSRSVNNFCDVKAEDSLLTVTAMLPDGRTLDAFTLRKGPELEEEERQAKSGSGWFDVFDVPGQRMAIFSFEPSPVGDNTLEIRTGKGSMIKKEPLAFAQASWSFDYSHLPQGKYLAVLRANGNTFTRKVTVAK